MILDDGRWRGAVTQRPIPEADAEIHALPVELCHRLAQLWWSQAATEGRVAKSFAVVAEALGRRSENHELKALAERAVDDEHRHVELCLLMARRYAEAGPRRHALAPPLELPFSHPSHPEARTPELRDALFVIGQCVFNETLANAYLSASYEAATHPMARAALRELLSDEVGHARIGWASLGQLPPTLREELAAWIHPLAVANLREWRKLTLLDAKVCSDSAESIVLARHGFLGKSRIEEALFEGMRDLIAPGLALVGLRTAPLNRWLDSGAPT